MQAGERQLHLGLDPRSTGDPAPAGVSSQVVEQSRLPDTRLTPDEQHPPFPGANVAHQPLQLRELRPPATKLVRRAAHRHGSTTRSRAEPLHAAILGIVRTERGSRRVQIAPTPVIDSPIAESSEASDDSALITD